MLFDLKGKRRRAVQGTYLMLAVLMGAGLVLFGIGSSVNGGLSDLFSGGNGSNQGDKVVQKKIDTAEKQLQVNPKNQAALGAVIRGHYQLATAKSDPNTGQFSKDARGDLQQAAVAWQRYLRDQPAEAGPRPRARDGAGVLRTGPAEQRRRVGGAAQLGRRRERHRADRGRPAERRPTTSRSCSTRRWPGQTSKADLAGKKAIQLAPKSQRKTVQQQVAAAKAAATSQAGGGAAGAPTGTAP